jgi:pimeloyl-ACP methyl ester carboxylesterase
MTATAKTLPIVFIPGASSDDTVWDAQKNHFAQATTAITVNLTSYDSIADMSAHVLAAVDGDFIICGTSMGGYVALDVLKKAHGRVKKVIFCNTAARADTPEKTAQRMAEVAAGAEAYAANRIDDTHYKTFLSDKSFEDKALVKKLRAVSERVGYACFKNHQIACSTRLDSIDFLSQIDIPALIIGGTEDTVTPPERQAEMKEKIPNAQLIMIPEVGHIAHMEAADTVTAAIEAFILDDTQGEQP